MFKVFRSLLSLFQIDGSINRMLFWHVTFFQRYLQSHVWSSFRYTSGGNKQFIYMEWSSQYFKTFVAVRCSTLSFFGCQFISSNSLAPMGCFVLCFKQKQIHLFWATCVFFLIFLQTKGYLKIPHSQSWIKELHNNPRNFGFRNSFCLYKNCNFALIFLRDFIAMGSLHKLASTQQSRYSTIWNGFILLLSYVMFSVGSFSSLLKIMHLVLSPPKWTDHLLSTNHLDTFANSLFETFPISEMSLCWWVSSGYRYVWLFDRACGISFMVHASKNTLSNETKKTLFVK